MEKLHYILPAEVCAQALYGYEIANEDAMSAHRDLQTEFGCEGMVRVGTKGIGLVFQAPRLINGFKNQKRLHDGRWFMRPDCSTDAGRLAQNKLDDCADLLDVMTWCLEKCLGVFGLVKEGGEAHFVIATRIDNGRIILSVPQGEWIKKDWNGVELADPVIPNEAELVGEETAKRLMSKLFSRL